jgi:hypothetical protein
MSIKRKPNPTYRTLQLRVKRCERRAAYLAAELGHARHAAAEAGRALDDQRKRFTAECELLSKRVLLARQATEIILLAAFPSGRVIDPEPSGTVLVALKAQGIL